MAGLHRNPSWSRDELILALDLYVRYKGNPPSKTSSDVQELSELLNRLSEASSTKAATFRNANGVYMKLMNFRRFDPAFTNAGKSGLTRGNKQEAVVWSEFGANPLALQAAVQSIRHAMNAAIDKG